MGELEALRRRYGGYAPGLLGARRSYAVLVPLLRTADGLRLLFEVRAAALRQGGEVCFPGGRMEPENGGKSWSDIGEKRDRSGKWPRIF